MEKTNKKLSLGGKKVLVTGGAGFIGSHLVDKLIDQNPSLILIVDNKATAKLDNLSDAFNKSKDIEIVQASINVMPVIKKIVAKYKPDAVFHLATLSLFDSLGKPWKTVMNNVGMATNLLELQRLGMLGTLVLMSSSEAYGTALTVPMSEIHPLNPMTPYAASKVSSDLIGLSYRRTFDSDVVIVRPFNQYGPRQNPAIRGIVTSTINALLSNNQPVIYGNGEQTRDYTFVKDTVVGLINAYKNPQTRGKVINIGSGKSIKMVELVEKLIRISGKDIKIKFEKNRVADVKDHCADIKLARRLIGWSPKVKIDDGLKETYEWYKNKLLIHEK